MSYIRRRRSHQSPNEGPLWVFCHYSTLWATTLSDAESPWRHPIIITLALVCLGASAEKGPLLLHSLPTEALDTLTARWIINLLSLSLHPLLDKQPPPPHDESEGESISFSTPRLSSVSVDTQMPTHMSLNKLQQYGGIHSLFRTSAEHLQADTAVPKHIRLCFTKAADTLHWIRPLTSNTKHC